MAVLAAIYLSECVFLVTPEQRAVTRWFGRLWRLVRPVRLSAFRDLAVAAGNPLPPLGTSFLCEPLPFLVLGGTTLAARDGRPLGEFARMGPVALRGREVAVEGLPPFKAGTEAAARAAAGVLERLRAAPGGERGRVMAEVHAASHDEAEAARRAGAYGAATRWLRGWCNGLVVFVFVACPLLAVLVGLILAWPLVLLGLVAGMAGVAVSYRRAARKLECPVPRTAVVALVPTAAMRAHDLLARDLMAGLDPLAVAAALLPREAAGRAVEERLRHLRFPRSGGASAGAASELGAAGALAARLGFDPEELATRVPERDADSVAWCPRCHAQYRKRIPHCRECEGVALRGFGAGA